MDCPNTAIFLNKDKRIGKVIFIVEGEKTEPYILCRIFEKIFDYHYTRINREGKVSYDVISSRSHDRSQVFVVNAEESNISKIKSGNEYLTIFYPAVNEHALILKMLRYSICGTRITNNVILQHKGFDVIMSKPTRNSFAMTAGVVTA